MRLSPSPTYVADQQRRDEETAAIVRGKYERGEPLSDYEKEFAHYALLRPENPYTRSFEEMKRVYQAGGQLSNAEKSFLFFNAPEVLEHRSQATGIQFANLNDREKSRWVRNKFEQRELLTQEELDYSLSHNIYAPEPASPLGSPNVSPIARNNQPFYSPNGSPDRNAPLSGGPISPGLVQEKYARGDALTPDEMKVAMRLGILPGGSASPPLPPAARGGGIEQTIRAKFEEGIPLTHEESNAAEALGLVPFLRGNDRNEMEIYQAHRRGEPLTNSERSYAYWRKLIRPADPASPGTSPTGQRDLPFWSPVGSPKMPPSARGGDIEDRLLSKYRDGIPLTDEEANLAGQLGLLPFMQALDREGRERSYAYYQQYIRPAGRGSPGMSPIGQRDLPFYSPVGSPQAQFSPANLSPGLIRNKYERGEALTPDEMNMARQMGILPGGSGSPPLSPVQGRQMPRLFEGVAPPPGALRADFATLMGQDRGTRGSPAAAEPRGSPVRSPRDEFFARVQPVEIINGIKIYDAADLPWEVQRDLPAAHEYMAQAGGNLTHIFMSNARRRLDESRKIEQVMPGVLATVEINLEILAKLFKMIWDLRADPNGPLHSTSDATFYAIIYPLIYNGYMNTGEAIQDFIGRHARDEVPQYQQLFTGLLAPAVEEAYGQLGYENSYYFGFVKSDNPFVKAHKGQIPLRPDTFEAFSLSGLNPSAYAAAGKRIDHGLIVYHTCIPADTRTVSHVAGWSKAQLVSAIKKSGLWKDVSRLRGVNRQARRGRYRNTDARLNQGIAWRDIGSTPQAYQEIVQGLGVSSGLPKCYYEALYRKIYSTTDFINWPLLCKLNAVSLEGIRSIAISHYDANPERVANASIPEICAFVTEQSRKRLELTQDLARDLAVEAKTTQAGFTFRPGSRWVAPPTMQLMAGPTGQPLPPIPDDDFRLYMMIKGYCEDPNVTRENMLGYVEGLRIRDLLPDVIEQYSKEDLCAYLLDVLLPRAEKYEGVLMDCSDPAIKVRHIINAANTMGLGAIFPKDISRLTKERACEIITNYIALLQQAKGLTIAESMGEVERQRRYFATDNSATRISPMAQSPAGSGL